MDRNNPTANSSKFRQLIAWCMSTWLYCSQGVWNDTRKTWRVNIIKTVNLSVKSFLSQDLQSRACALTYRTILAIVPALALLFAIGRGFGLQDVLQKELIKYFPSQRQVLDTAFGFVDSYLSQASGGIFVGIGIVFLLWTLISLLSSVEESFNTIWQLSAGRSFWRKVTDYLAIFILLPVLMICASGLSLFMTTSLKTLLPFEFIDSALPMIFDFLSVVLSWLFFAGSYMLIPNTKVRPLSAIVAGVAVGSAYQILQWLFISGQMYVAKYNAIYGSFSFVPLMLIWLQLVWLITLIGAVLCYASQNISEFNFEDKIKNISPNYRMQICIAVMSIVARRFQERKSPLTAHEIAQEQDIPINLIRTVVEKLYAAGLINYIESPERDLSTHPIQPAIEVSQLTIGQVASTLYNHGEAGFLKGFDSHSASTIAQSSEIFTATMQKAADTPIINALDNINQPK